MLDGLTMLVEKKRVKVGTNMTRVGDINTMSKVRKEEDINTMKGENKIQKEQDSIQMLRVNIHKLQNKIQRERINTLRLLKQQVKMKQGRGHYMRVIE